MTAVSLADLTAGIPEGPRVDPDAVADLVAANALAASKETGVPVGFVSRSDSTLRGHFPLEPRTLAEEWRSADVQVDGVLVVPAFGDAGRLGQRVHPPLERADADAIAGAGTGQDAGGGLVVVGSHVALTTRQLDALRERRAPTEIEIEVARVLDAEQREQHLEQVIAAAAKALAEGTVVVRTSRTLVTGADGDSSLDIARQVSQAVVDVVQGILRRRPPRFVIAKGGITSSDIATRGLEITRAFVRGPMLPGIVSLWEPIDGPATGIPYIVFANNVGSDRSLADVVDKLSL